MKPSNNDPVTKIDTGSQPAAALEDELAQATEEFFSRVDAGQEPDIEAFAAKYPELQSVLLSVLPALALMQGSFAGSSAAAANTRELEAGGNPAQGSEAGVRLGDYELLREVGRGGMGVVYEAKQVSLDRRVALKVLPFAATLDSKRIQRFRNESQAVASLDHSSIVEVYSVGCEEGVHYYAMRFVDGHSLADIIAQLRFGKRNATQSQPTQTSENLKSGDVTNQDTRVDVAESTDRSHRILASYGSHVSAGIRNAARLIYEIALALDHAHQQGIVHRDVKPGNILVDLDGNPWIADFGLAQVASSESLTLTGDLLGTLRYMAPEQLDASPTDHRIDIYALGASFYELLTLEPLVAGDDRESLMRCVRDGKQTPPSRLNSKIPRDLETIVMKAIDRDPQSRYATAAALAGDLQAWLDGRSISARRASSIERSWRWCRRNPVVAGLLSAVLLLTGGIAVVAVVAAVVTNRSLIAERMANAREQAALADEQQARKAAEELAARNGELISKKDQVLSFLTANVFGQATPEVEKDRNISFRQVLDNSAVAARQLDLEPEIKAEILNELGKVYFSLSEYPSSLELFEAAYDVAISTLTETHPVVMTSLDQQAMVLIRMEKFEQAMPILERAIRLQNAVLGPDHEDSLHSYAKLGDLFERSGRIEQAIAITEEVLERRTRLFGAEYPFVLVSMNGLALSYQKVGRFEEAVLLLREAVRIGTEVHGELHPNVLSFKNNLALALINVNALEEALVLAEYALEERRKVLPEEHSYVFASRHTVAMVWFAMGASKECLAECRDMLALYNEPSVRFGRVKILQGQCLLELKQHKSAATELMAADTLLTDRLGPDNSYSTFARRLLETID